jgi:hypothetical protein
MPFLLVFPDAGLEAVYTRVDNFPYESTYDLWQIVWVHDSLYDIKIWCYVHERYDFAYESVYDLRLKEGENKVKRKIKLCPI